LDPRTRAASWAVPAFPLWAAIGIAGADIGIAGDNIGIAGADIGIADDNACTGTMGG